MSGPLGGSWAEDNPVQVAFALWLFLWFLKADQNEQNLSLTSWACTDAAGWSLLFGRVPVGKIQANVPSPDYAWSSQAETVKGCQDPAGQRLTPGWDFVGYHQGPGSPVLGQGCLREEECRTESHHRT